MGRRGEAKLQSLGVLGHAVDAAAERKRLSGELQTQPRPARDLHLWKTESQPLRCSDQRGQGEL